MVASEQGEARRRRAVRLLSWFVLLGCATAVLIGVLYDPHASLSAVFIHIAVAAVGLGLIFVVIGLLIVFVLGLRGRAFPPD